MPCMHAAGMPCARESQQDCHSLTASLVYYEFIELTYADLLLQF